MVYSLLFMARPDHLEADLEMARSCLTSVAACSDSPGDTRLVAYNQGPMPSAEAEAFIRGFVPGAVVLGDGQNAGIPLGRQATFEYIWEQWPGEAYICEMHLDMILYPGWERPIVQCLENMEEPMMSPSLVGWGGHVYPSAGSEGLVEVPGSPEAIMAWLPTLSAGHGLEARAGLVHPAIHSSQALKAVGGYDTDFLTGSQGYDDISLILGYHYYMGTKAAWVPKVCRGSVVFHVAAAQRFTLPNLQQEVDRNLAGLCRQYGAYGMRELVQMSVFWPPDLAMRLFDDMKRGQMPA